MRQKLTPAATVASTGFYKSWFLCVKNLVEQRVGVFQTGAFWEAAADLQVPCSFYIHKNL